MIAECRQRAIEHDGIDQGGRFGIGSVLEEQEVVEHGRGPAVEVLVLDGDKEFIEQRISLAPHLDEWTLNDRRRYLIQNRHLAAAGRRIHSDYLVGSAELADRNGSHDHVDIESAL